MLCRWLSPLVSRTAGDAIRPPVEEAAPVEEAKKYRGWGAEAKRAAAMSLSDLSKGAAIVKGISNYAARASNPCLPSLLKPEFASPPEQSSPSMPAFPAKTTVFASPLEQSSIQTSI